MQIFSVQGMSCGHCVGAVTKAVQAADPAASVEVNLKDKEVRVQSRLPDEQVSALISDAGYPAKLA